MWLNIAAKLVPGMIKTGMKIATNRRKAKELESIAEMKVAQDREEALLKAQDSNNKTYGQILKDVRSSDTDTRGD